MEESKHIELIRKAAARATQVVQGAIAQAGNPKNTGFEGEACLKLSELLLKYVEVSSPAPVEALLSLWPFIDAVSKLERVVRSLRRSVARLLLQYHLLDMFLAYSHAVEAFLNQPEVFSDCRWKSGDAYRLLKGFGFAIYYWKSLLGFEAYQNLNIQLIRESRSVDFAVDIGGAFFSKFSLLAKATLTCLFSYERAIIVGSEEAKQIDDIADHSDLVDMVSELSLFIVDTALHQKSHHKVKPVSTTDNLVTYVGLVRLLSIDGRFVDLYWKKDLSKGWSAHVFVHILERMDEVIEAKDSARLLWLGEELLESGDYDLTTKILSRRKSLDLMLEKGNLLQVKAEEGQTPGQRLELLCSSAWLIAMRTAMLSRIETKQQNKYTLSIDQLGSLTALLDAFKLASGAYTQCLQLGSLEEDSRISYTAAVDLASRALKSVARQIREPFSPLDVSNADTAIAAMRSLSALAETEARLPGSLKAFKDDKHLCKRVVYLGRSVRNTLRLALLPFTNFFPLFKKCMRNGSAQIRPYGKRLTEVLDEVYGALYSGSKDGFILAKLLSKSHLEQVPYATAVWGQSDLIELCPPLAHIIHCMSIFQRWNSSERDVHRLNGAILEVLHVFGHLPAECIENVDPAVGSMMSTAVNGFPFMTGEERGLKVLRRVDPAFNGVKLPANSEEAHARLMNRAKALSTLPCANLSCTTLKPSFIPGKDKIKTKHCDACGVTHYCSIKCQKKCWNPEHKLVCQSLAEAHIAEQANNV